METLITNFLQSKLYGYQMDAVIEADKVNKGIICLPTGMGKTYIQAAMVADAIRKNPGFAVYVVNAPRITLSFQLYKEITTVLTELKLDARYVNLNSGRHGEDSSLNELRRLNGIQHSDIHSGTSIGQINEQVEMARIENQPVVIFATYHSAGRLKNLSTKVDMVLNDEAHYLATEQFHYTIQDINADRNYFFTATMRESSSDEGVGMQNEEVYGRVIKYVSPIEAIAMGKMARVRLHYTITRDGSVFTEVDKKIGKVVEESFRQHQFQLSNYNAKMLVVVDGVSQIKQYIDSEECQEFQEAGGYVFAIASDKAIGNYINGERVTRNSFLTTLKEVGANLTTRMVVLHYDTLSEGIDVPGLTGCLMLRDLSKAKLIQNLGRILRLDTRDRNAIDSGTLSSSEVKKYKKPYGYLILPLLEESDRDTVARCEGIVDELRSFDFNPVDDFIFTDAGNAIPTIDGPEAMPKVQQIKHSLVDMLEDTVAEIESEEFAKLDIISMLAA